MLSGKSKSTRGAAKSSPATGPTLFDTTTCEPWARGSEPWTSSAADSLARTCPWLEPESDSEGSDPPSGESIDGSLLYFDPVSSSWRTSLGSFIRVVDICRLYDLQNSIDVRNFRLDEAVLRMSPIRS